MQNRAAQSKVGLKRKKGGRRAQDWTEFSTDTHTDFSESQTLWQHGLVSAKRWQQMRRNPTLKTLGKNIKAKQQTAGTL